LDEGTVKSGTAETRAAAMNSAVWLIDKALAPKKNTAEISAFRLVADLPISARYACRAALGNEPRINY
jgi:hypothetical protein